MDENDNDKRSKIISPKDGSRIINSSANKNKPYFLELTSHGNHDCSNSTATTKWHASPYRKRVISMQTSRNMGGSLTDRSDTN